MPRSSALIRMPDGTVTIVCGAAGAIKACQFCGVLMTALCDYPVAKGKTCDARLCDRCRVRQGTNRDFCPPHARLVSQGRLPLQEAV